jgi:hypothetical protein
VTAEERFQSLKRELSESAQGGGCYCMADLWDGRSVVRVFAAPCGQVSYWSGHATEDYARDHRQVCRSVLCRAEVSLPGSLEATESTTELAAGAAEGSE